MPVMSPLESTLWYLSLPVLLYVSWRFIVLNVKQYERVNPEPAPTPATPPSPEP